MRGFAFLLLGLLEGKLVQALFPPGSLVLLPLYQALPGLFFSVPCGCPGCVNSKHWDFLAARCGAIIFNYSAKKPL